MSTKDKHKSRQDLKALNNHRAALIDKIKHKFHLIGKIKMTHDTSYAYDLLRRYCSKCFFLGIKAAGGFSSKV